jgi:hypothetical protein
MVTIQIVLHMRDLNLLGGSLSERMRRQVEDEMIKGEKDHRIAYRADLGSSLHHTLMIYMVLQLLLRIGIGTRWSWRDGTSWDFYLISLDTVASQEEFAVGRDWWGGVAVGHNTIGDLLRGVVDIVCVSPRLGSRGFTGWRRWCCCASGHGSLLGKKVFQSG